MKKKIVILVVIITSVILILSVIRNWNSYDPYCEGKKHYYLYKSIELKNKLDSTGITIKINLKYSREDSLQYHIEPKSDSIIYINETDSFTLETYASTYLFLTSILKDNSISFPSSFYIRVYDEKTNILLKELDYFSFKGYAIPENMNNKNIFLTANSWTLVIDSTLLDLK